MCEPSIAVFHTTPTPYNHFIYIGEFGRILFLFLICYDNLKSSMLHGLRRE